MSGVKASPASGSKMINLIDAASKRDLKAARMNIVLLTYCVVVVCALLCIVLLFLFSHWWLNNKITASVNEKAANQAQTAPYAPVRAEAAAFSANLNKIQSVLSSRSQYGTAMLNIAASLPDGASVASLTFSPAFITTPVSITATTATNEAAFALKDTLSKSPIYSKVTLDNVNCGGSNGSSCQVSITGTLSQKVFTAGATE